MLSRNLRLDDIDNKIIEILQNNPNTTHSKIAEKVHRSQPTVGLRIKRLEDSGKLEFQAGLNLKKSNLYFASLSLQTESPETLIKLTHQCPHVIYAFRTSGIKNFQIIIISSKLKDLDKIVNYHFRNNQKIKLVSMEIITEFINNIILPIDTNFYGCNCLS